MFQPSPFNESSRSTANSEPFAQRKLYIDRERDSSAATVFHMLGSPRTRPIHTTIRSLPFQSRCDDANPGRVRMTHSERARAVPCESRKTMQRRPRLSEVLRSKGCNIKNLRYAISVLCIAVMILAPTVSLAQMAGPGPYSKTAESGKLTFIHHHSTAKIVSLKIVSRPSHGKAVISKEGDRTNVRYQSRPGFHGVDSFTYVRVSQDRYAGNYTITVTVK